MKDVWMDDLVTEAGMKWNPRLLSSEQYHRINSKDWDDLRNLYAELGKYEASDGTRVAIGWSIIQNLVSDVYHKNPDPWIVPKTPLADKTLARILRNVTRTIHKETDTEGIVRDALSTESWAGFAGDWRSFGQDDHEEDNPLEIDGVPQRDPGTGKQLFSDKPLIVPDRQWIEGEYTSPWDIRFDSDGRRWDLLDHKFLIRRYRRTLKEFIDDPAISKRAKRMLKAWVNGHRSSYTNEMESGGLDTKDYAELDPAYITVECAEIWDRVEKEIIHVPADGEDYAEFDIMVEDWPPDFAAANGGRGEFPFTFIAFNKAPEDKQGKRGFYPIPTLRLIRQQLENINRLELLFLETATLAIRKYVSMAGILDQKAIAKLSSDVNREVLTIDPSTLKELLGQTYDMSQFDIRNFIHLLPQEERGEAIRNLEAIEHQIDLIHQIIGQGPADRGGLAESGSATEALNLAARLEKRIDARVQQAGNHYDSITAKCFLLLKGRQILPFRYQIPAGKFNPSVWREFHASDIDGIDLAYEHRTGAQRPRTRAQEFQERQQAVTTILPAIQSDLGLVRELFIWSIEPLDVSDEITEIMKQSNSAKELAKQLAAITAGLEQGMLDPTDPQVANRKTELTSKLIRTILTDEDAAEMFGGGGGGGDVGSLPKGQSQGQVAFNQALPGEGSAAAGRANTG